MLSNSFLQNITRGWIINLDLYLFSQQMGRTDELANPLQKCLFYFLPAESKIHFQERLSDFKTWM